MSEFPLYELVRQQPAPISRMEGYLRDADKPREVVEGRRKAELKAHITDLKNGKHPLLVTLSALETILGWNHPLSHLRSNAVDTDSFRHHLRKEKDQTPEQFQDARKTHIEKIIKGNFFDSVHAIPFTADAQLMAWVDGLLKKIDEEGTHSFDVADKLIGNFTRGEYDYYSNRLQTDFGLGAIKQKMAEIRANEDIDNLVHPNDRYIEGDLLHVLWSYKERRSFAESQTVDKYQTQEDIELRRSVEVLETLRRWQKGAHPFLVMTDVMGAAFGWIDNPLHNLIVHAQAHKKDEQQGRKEKFAATESDLRHAEHTLVSAKEGQIKTRREARQIMRSMRPEIVAYRGPESNPDLAAQIEAFITHLEGGSERSLSIIQGVAEAFFQPVDDKRHRIDPMAGLHLDHGDEDTLSPLSFVSHDAPLLTQIRERLARAQEEEDKRFESSKPMDALRTQTEKETREPLKDVFRRRARNQRKTDYKPLEKLTNEIHIEVLGSGMIKPFASEYGDYHEEEMYGTTTARVTTYSVSFVPKDSARLQELAGYVKWGLKKLASIQPAFESPFDMDSDPYVRPHLRKKDEYGWSRRRLSSMHTLHAEIRDGKAHVYAPLDLDDVWNLYYLLEDIIEPSEQIAAAMNAARYAEGRGVLLQKADMSEPYSNDALTPEEQMGSLEQEKPEKYVPAMMEQTLSLYALGEINEEQFLQRVMVLADHTLTGRMVDPDGILPTFKSITDQSDGQPGGEVVTYDDALKERTRHILMLMTGTADKDRPLFPALIAKVAEVSRPLRDKLRKGALKREERRWDDIFSPHDKARSRMDFSDLFDSKAKSTSPEEEEGGEDTETEEAAKEAREAEDKEKKRAIAHRANIALRSSEVGATTDRTWRDTTYVSRSPGSLWVRKELPAALAAYVRTQPRPDMSQALRALTHEVK